MRQKTENEKEPMVLVASSKKNRMLQMADKGFSVVVLVRYLIVIRTMFSTDFFHAWCEKGQMAVVHKWKQSTTVCNVSVVIHFFAKWFGIILFHESIDTTALAG